MKTKSFTSRLYSGSAFAASLALTMVLSRLCFSATDTNAAVIATASNTTSLAVADAGKTNTANVLGLPQETLNRLSASQIMELMQQRQRTERSEQGPTFPEMVIALAVPLGVPLGSFAMVVGIVWLGVGLKLKRNKMLHETIRLMIDKGQPIPPELLQPQELASRPRSDLRTGLVMIAVGIGLSLLLISLHDLPRGIAAVGVIPFLMGVAFLIAWKIESNKNGQPK